MRKTALGVVLAVLVAAVPAAFSQDNYSVVNGPEKTYYGHVSLTEILNDGKDAVVIRPDEPKPLPAILNFPLAPGDTIKTSDARRLEIQFDNATIVRLDYGTELKIETILARSLSRRDISMTNLVLNAGRITVMYKEYDKSELFQVLTPNAAVKLRHNSVATIAAGPDGATDVQVAFGKATAMFGPDEKHLLESSASRNERLVIDKSLKAMAGAPAPASEFDSWNAGINKNFEALHEGKSALPKPLIRNMTKATWYFAQTFGDKYGEWLYDDLYGYVWRPFYNDRYPGGTWKPYFAGQWVDMAGQMFWIPSEPWGWVPYHLGVWLWDAKRGWYWLPGSAFAPAWVDWQYFNGYSFAWSPWSFFDWMFYGRWTGYYGVGYAPGGYYGYGSWIYWVMYPMFGYFNGYYGDNYSYFYAGKNNPWYYGEDGNEKMRSTLYQVSKDQLKKPSSGSPALKMPKEYNRIIKAIEAGLKRGDPGIMEKLRAGVQPGFMGRDKVIGGAGIPRRFDIPERKLDAWKPRVSALLNKMIPTVAPIKTRATDWNPDVRLGARLGVNIRYSSRSNEVFSPELNLSSRMLGSRTFLTDRGSARSSGGSYSPGISGGSMSTGSSSSSSSSGSSSSSSSSGGGGGGHIR